MCATEAVAKMAKNSTLSGTETGVCEAEHPLHGYDQELHQGIIPLIGPTVDRTKK